MSVYTLFENRLGWTAVDMKKRKAALEDLSNLNEKQLVQTFDYFEEAFSLTDDDMSKMLKIQPMLLILSKKTIDEKIDFYDKTIGVKLEDLSDMITVSPNLLAYVDNVIKTRSRFCMAMFDLKQNEFVEMIKRKPTLLDRSEKSMFDKSRQILELDIDKKHIVNAPDIIDVPNNTLKLRYAVLRQAFSREEIFSNPNWFMVNPSVAFARLGYMKDLGKQVAIENVVATEQDFQTSFGVKSVDLARKYLLERKHFKELGKILQQDGIADFTIPEKIAFDNEWGDL